MTAKHIYLALSILGLIIPYYSFVGFLIQNGTDINLFFELTFDNKISTFWTLDVILTAITLIIFFSIDSGLKSKKTAYSTIGTLLIGPSFGLPFYLYLKEKSGKY